MFNNREIATIFWLTVFLIWILIQPQIRLSIARVFCALLNWKILTCIAAMLLYTSAIVAALYYVGFWQATMIKDTILWFCFTAFAMVMRFSTSGHNDGILRSVLADNVKLIIFVEFLIGTYVMSLPAELIFIPLMTFVVMLDTVAKFNKEHAAVAKITTFSLTAIGFVVLAFVMSRAIGDFSNLGSASTIRAIAFPPLMSITFVPFIYAIVLIVAYESIFARLAVGPDKSPDVISYAKRRIFFHCGFSLCRLRALSKRPPFEIMEFKSITDVDRLFSVPNQNAG